MRKICVITGTRADYGLLYWLMKGIASSPEIELQIIATGMHLSPEFGLTYRTIEEDGFQIDAKVEMLLSSDTPIGIAKSIGLGVIGFADAFERLKPNIVVVLGDRYEVLAAAQAALVARLPIAHIHGGELTEGAIDDSIRHCVTKMSHLHFVAAEEYRQRVIQLGETPDTVFNFGTIGLDNIERLSLLDKEELEKAISFCLGKLSFLVTYHPVTLKEQSSASAMNELLLALDAFPEAKIIFTRPNSDTDGRIIMQMIDEYVRRNPQRAIVFSSLGQLRYLSAMKHVDAVIGNSSSGIIEAPALRKPTINIGERQKGRLRAASVIDCPEEAEAIKISIEKALSADFLERLTLMKPPYGHGNDVSGRITDILKKTKLQGIIYKQFYDIGIKG